MEQSDKLIKEINKAIGYVAKIKLVDFFRCKLSATLLGNVLTGKGIINTGHGKIRVAE